MMFLSGVVYYLVRVVMFGAMAGLGIFIGIKLRKNKDLKSE